MFKKKYFRTHLDNNLNYNLDQASFISNRIRIVEKYFPQLQIAFYNYIDKNAKSRDCIDKIAMILNKYGKAENLTSHFKLQMNNFSDILLDVGTEKDAQVQTMETKILEQLNEYDKLCEHLELELKLSSIANEKERNWSKQLQRTKQAQPQESEKISLTEAEVLKAKRESLRSSKNLEEQTETFERRRLTALKEILLAWALAELQFHSRALQLFTNAYQIAADMDVSCDIKEFRNKLRSIGDAHLSDSCIGSNSVFQLRPALLQNNMKFNGSRIPHPCSSFNSPQSSHSSFYGE